MDEIIYLTDGTPIQFPEGTDPLLIRYFRERYADIIAPEPGIGGALVEGALNIPRGFVSTAALMGRGLGQIMGTDGEASTAVMDAIGGTMDPRYADSFLANLGSGIGSIAAFAGPAIATGGLGPAASLGASAAAGALSGVGEQAVRMDDIREAGGEVTPEEEAIAMLGGLGIGLTEAAPVGRVAGRIRRAFGAGAATRLAGDAAQEATEGALSSALRTGLYEGSQEVLAGTGQNILSRYTYDPETQIAPSMMEFTVGGTAGAIFDLLGSAAARRAGRAMGAGDYLAEQRIRMQEILGEGPIRFDEVLADMESQGPGFDPVQYARDFDVREISTGQFQVVDAGTGEALSMPMTREEANEHVAKLDRDAADKIVAAHSIMLARNQGRATSPETVQALYEVLHPDSREIPLPQVAAQLSNETMSDVFLMDPRSRIGVENFRRGFNLAEEAELAEASDVFQYTEDQLAEARARTPTFAAAPVRRDAGTRSRPARRTGLNAGAYDLDIDGRKYRILKYGRLGWAVYEPGKNVVSRYAFTPTLREAENVARQLERDHRAVLSAKKRENQQKYINRLKREREVNMLEARKKLEKLEKYVAENPEDQPRFDVLARMAEEGRSSITPEEARRILGRTAYDQLMLNLAGMKLATQRDLMEEYRGTLTKAGKPRARAKGDTESLVRSIVEDFLATVPESEGMLAQMQPTGEITTTMLNNALRNNGWDPGTGSRAAMKYASLLVGRPVEKPGDLTQGEKAYLLSRFATMATGDVGNEITLPDPAPITYNAAQFEETLGRLKEKDGPVRRNAFVSEMVDWFNSGRPERIPTTEAQIQQVLDHNLTSGRVKTTGKAQGQAYGVQYVSDTPAMATRPADESRLNELARRIARQNGRDEITTADRVMAEEVRNATKEANDALARQVLINARAQGRANRPIPGARAAGQMSVDMPGLAEAQKRLEERIAEATPAIARLSKGVGDFIKSRLNLQGEQARRLDIRVMEDTEQIASLVGRKAINPKAEAVFVADPGSPMRILFNLKAVDPDGTMAEDEILRRLEPTALYETTRFLFEADYITTGEKRAALRAAESMARPDGRIYADAARTTLRDRGVTEDTPGFTERLTEQAMADMAYDYRTGQLQQGMPAPPRSITQKILQFLKDLVNFQKRADVRDTLNLLNRITTGTLNRTPGLSRVNPTDEAPVRSLRRQEMGASLRGTGPPSAASPATGGVTPPDGALRYRLKDEEELAGIDPADIEVAETWDDPNYWYHVTHTRNAEAILEEGFDHGFPNMGVSGVLRANSRGRTFFTEGSEVGKWRGLQEMVNLSNIDYVEGGRGPEDDVVVLRIPKSVMPDVLQVDELANGDDRTRTAVFAPTEMVMSPERREMLEAERDAQIQADLERGVIPVHGPNTSAEAIEAYRESQNSTKEETDPNLRYRILRDPVGTDPFGGRYTSAVDYAPAQTSLFDRFYDAIKSFGIIDGLRGDDGRRYFNDLRRRFRSNILDGRNEVDRLTDKYRRYIANRDGVEMLADQQAIHSMRTLDRLTQMLSEATRGGVMRYVQGAQVNGQWVRSTDPLAGHFVIDRTPIVTESGKQYDSLIDILFEPYVRGDEGEKWFHNYLVARRYLKIREDSRRARSRLASKDYADRAELEDLKRRARLDKAVPEGTSMEQFEDMVAEVESRADLQWMVDAQQGLTAWNDSILQMLLDSGVLPQEQYDAWVGETYIAFTKGHRNVAWEGELKAPTKEESRKRAVARREIEIKLQGSEDILTTDLYTSVVSNFEAMVHDAVANTGYARVVKALSDMPIEESGKPYGRFVERSELRGEPWAIRFFEDGQEKIFLLDVENYPEAEFLVAAMQHSGEDFVKGALRIVPAAADLLRQGVTRMPQFVVRNLFKDTIAIWTTSGAEFTPIVDTMAKFNSSIRASLDPGRTDPSFELAKAMGLALETDTLNDRSRHKDNMKRALDQRQHLKTGKWDTGSVVMRTWNWLGDISRQSDTSTRMSVFDRVLAQTGNYAEATKQALEVINYGRRGRSPVWRLITAGIPFLNARMQGLDVLYRGAKGDYTARELDANGRRRAARDITREFVTRGLYLAAVTGAYYLMVRDQDWYKGERDEVKDDYFMLPLTSDQALRVPAPFEVGLIFKTFPEQAMRWMDEEGYTGDDWARSATKAFLQTTMFNPMPQLISPLFDVWRNYNSFTRSNITPTYMEEGLPYQDRRTLSTSQTAQMLAALVNSVPGAERVLNLDPLKMEYLVGGYTGTMGELVLGILDAVMAQGPAAKIFNSIPLIDPMREQVGVDAVGTRADYGDVNNLPVIGSFLQDIGRADGLQQDFYEIRETLNQAVAGINKAREEGRLDDLRSLQHERAAILQTRATVRRLDRYMSQWRRRRDRLLRNDDISKDQRRLLLENLEEERDLQLAIVPFLKELASMGGEIR